MKKILLVVAAFAMFAVQSNAQGLADFKFGVKGGANFANLTDDLDGDSKTGFNLGIVCEFMLSDQLAFQPEVLYSSQGSEFDYGTVETEVDLNYISVPMMFKYYVGPGFNIQAGPQVAFLVDDDVEFNGSFVEGKRDLGDTKSVDFGINVGLGYRFYENIFIDARYNFGFTDVLEDIDGKNSVFQLSVGYMF